MGRRKRGANESPKRFGKGHNVTVITSVQGVLVTALEGIMILCWDLIVIVAQERAV